MKVNLHISDDIDDRNQDDDDDGDFFRELEGDDTQTNTDDDDEVLCYAKLENIKVKNDPLIWWVIVFLLYYSLQENIFRSRQLQCQVNDCFLTLVIIFLRKELV